MPTFSRTYILPILVGVTLATAGTYASIRLEPFLLDMAPRQDAAALAASWIPTLLSVAPWLLVGALSIKRPLLLGFIAALIASVLFYGFVSYKSATPTSPLTLLSLLNSACQGALYSAFFACAGHMMGSNNSFKPKPLRGSA